MARWKICGKDFELRYTVKVHDMDCIFDTWFPAEVERRGRSVHFISYVSIVEMRFVNRESAKIFYAWIQNKTVKEKRHIVINMVENYYAERLKEIEKGKEKLKRLEEVE